jgi:squalene synthase HpnC
MMNLWHTLCFMKSHSLPQQSRAYQDATQASMRHAATHYENFPVASVLLPQHLRAPISVIYSFARQADDFADEGDLSIEARLALLQRFRDELDLIQAYIQPNTDFFNTLQATIRQHQLPLAPFYDLLAAFSQDVVKTRYANFDEVRAYCQLSANPVGTLLLHLYRQANPHNLNLSNHICSALQLINFYQDIAIDFKKNDGKKRVYLCQDELANFGISEQDIANQVINEKWQALMQMNIERAAQMLQTGKPLGRILTGRIGLEMRMIIAGGERIIAKLLACKGDIYHHRPTLNAFDWAIILMKALFKQ